MGPQYRNRYSLAARILLCHLKELDGKPISYDDLAAELGYDRDTIRVSLRRLEKGQQIVKVKRGGGKANRYLPVARVALPHPATR